DLDRVVLKALRHDPAERYSSVDQFSEDLDRWLHNKPILARPSTLTYHVRKFVTRHKAGVAGAAAIALGLSATTGWALYQTRLAREARQRADQRFQETRELAN